MRGSAAGFVLALAAPGLGAQDATDIVVLDLRPHEDHVHVGSMVRVTDRDGYDNQPAFVDDDRILFSSIRDDGQSDAFLFVLSEGRLEPATRTPESEYSPRPLPSHTGFSVVRVEMDGVSQHLYRVPWDGRGGERLLPDVADVGYYAWAGEDHALLYRVGEPATLHVADFRTGDLRLLQADVGRSLQSIPGTGEASFVDRSNPERPVLKRFDPGSGEVRTVAALPPGADEHAWLSATTVLVGDQGVLLRSTGDPARPWHPIVDLREQFGEFTRIAVSPAGLRIALVVPRQGG